MIDYNKFREDSSKNILFFDYENIEKLSVVSPGYIITDLGKAIKIPENQDHNDLFSQYMYFFSGFKQYVRYESTYGVKAICKTNGIVYFGAKLGDVRSKNAYTGMLFFPENISEITEEQKETIRCLLATNISPITNKKRIEIIFGDILTGKLYSEDDVSIILKSSINKNLVK